MTLERRSLFAMGAGLAAGLAEARPAGATAAADLPMAAEPCGTS